MYSVKIIADSVSTHTGKRITTFELTYPRFIHSELMTHRLFSRNAASSRAIPVAKMLKRVKDDPAFPLEWGKNQKGMQAAEKFEGEAVIYFRHKWLEASKHALRLAEDMTDAGLHKQVANRILEPFSFITVILTATEYDNFFLLRDSPHAQPELAWVAREMRKQYESRTPVQLSKGDWHLPYVYDEDVKWAWEMDRDEVTLFLKFISAGRCARVSYLTHDGKRDPQADIDLAKRLLENRHLSPFEHVATPTLYPSRIGNFVGWRQMRKDIPDEHPTAIEGDVSLTREEATALRRHLLGARMECLDDITAYMRAVDKLRG